MLILDGDFAEKLKNVLNDPEAMSKILSIASGLGLSDTSGPKAEEAPKREESEPISEPTFSSSESLPALMQGFGQSNDPRITLLASLKPLVREEKRERLDALTRALTLASMMKNFRK